MSGSDLIVTIEKFFSDIIGAVIPGIITVLGVAFILYYNDVITDGEFNNLVKHSPWALIAISFAIGHLLLSIGDFCIISLINRLKNVAKNSPCLKEILSILFGKSLFFNINDDPLYHIYIKYMKETYKYYEENFNEVNKYNTWRNIILSKFPEEK